MWAHALCFKIDNAKGTNHVIQYEDEKYDTRWQDHNAIKYESLCNTNYLGL